MTNKQPIGNINMSVFLSKEKFVETLACKAEEKEKLNLYFLNDHGFNIAQKDAEYRKILNRADYLLNDGIGIKLGARIWGIHVGENLNGTDLIPLFLRECEKKGWSVYLLGSTETIAGEAAQHLREKYRRLKVAGSHHGYFRGEQEIVRAINKSGADVLIVGMGMPLQEKFIDRHDRELAPRIRIAAGGYIDFVSGEKPRAPKVMRKLNLEWLFRMILEPKRMWRRNVVGHLQFFFKVIQLKRKKRL
ncbi:WecB/TagA/CpsF family glycosyltransferase [Sporolactobacillus sp. CQH2019]|uniref:WecB/TagA/CpsF family glycosyltransferase n=1 Tax=Sporolactobacillus sp. CQH2019 TaxID=3023512 RepID=UPI0023683B39|nr:WecB/TagA/CpsF family glycosyltransferase [Sporolactobacillus sp. CQH2019]MDD9148039.1 WecB/TagA/CpsF family glycosyltransferase [Sporolactobacillus sp. CQH2019]